MMDIKNVWSRIEEHAGEKFYQIRGGEFTYFVDSSHIYIDRTNQRIPRSHIEKALSLVPLENTGIVKHFV